MFPQEQSFLLKPLPARGPQFVSLWGTPLNGTELYIRWLIFTALIAREGHHKKHASLGFAAETEGSSSLKEEASENLLSALWKTK